MIIYNNHEASELTPTVLDKRPEVSYCDGAAASEGRSLCRVNLKPIRQLLTSGPLCLIMEIVRSSKRL